MKSAKRTAWAGAGLIVCAIAGAVILQIVAKEHHSGRPSSQGRSPGAALAFLNAADSFSRQPQDRRAGAVRADAPRTDAACDASAIEGAYGFEVTGMNVRLGAAFASVGRFVSDGREGLSGSATESANGAISDASFTGKYTIKQDCTGYAQLFFKDGRVSGLNFVVVANGTEILLMSSAETTIEAGSAQKQFQTSPASVENSSRVRQPALSAR